MNDKEKQEYLEQYHKAKENGYPFFPYILFKDAVVSLLIFIVLIGLAIFPGAPLEDRANPADTAYTPRPEWYFIFLFQLLKRFPGNLEVVGAVVLPTLAILALFFLPFLDRGPRRHFTSRPWVTAITGLLAAGVIFLTVQAYNETPPPKETARGDETASLYARNCAGCHGSTIEVSSGTNLHTIIAQGSHEGMPAWSADLTNDQIDALAGFILSPGGSALFTKNCGDCHDVSELVAGDPLQLKRSLEEGVNFPPHQGLEIPQWTEILSQENRTALLNFLVAPDGQRLYATNCYACHGRSIAFSGEESELRTIISQGGLHLEMPPWREKLSSSELDTLAKLVVDPSSAPQGRDLFRSYCSTCHGVRIPVATDIDLAKDIIASGGAHQTMPVWGNSLTIEQLDALVTYTMDTVKGTPIELGQELFASSCSPCHGAFGEGGPNPARAGDIIAPISTAEYLKTRDDFTLRAVIAQGQPNFGMSPFGLNYGGPLDENEIDAIVAYLRLLELNPPVEQPVEVPSSSSTALAGPEIYANLCAQCHGPNGEGGIGPTLAGTEFQAANTDEAIFDTINLGHKATAMIGWGEILSAEQIQELVKFIRQFKPVDELQATSVPATFSAVMKIFEAKCIVCHGTMGGWDGTTYTSIINSGDNGPAVLPGDVDGSLLAQKLLGTQTIGGIMPPVAKLTEAEIQTVIEWIRAGAPQE